MRSLPRRFRTLRWRLSLSYFVAAFVALMSLEVVFVVLPAFFSLGASPHPVALSQGMVSLASQASTYVNHTPPDRAELTNWLHAPKQTIYIPVGLTDNIHQSSVVTPGQNASLFVLGATGQTLASRMPTSPDANNLSDIEGLAEARMVVSAALHGETNAKLVIKTTTDGRTLAAAPITDGHAHVLGALLLGVNLTSQITQIALLNVLSLAPSVIPFGIIASLFGALFGMLTARSLTRRLQRLAVAAEAWSGGDFAVSAYDPSTDELGQLARDLNRMAEQLQNLLQDRQQLAALEERNRLARDLHDSVKQQMFALTMLVGSAQMEVDEGSEVKRILGEVDCIVGNAQQEMAALIHALRPVALTTKGLGEALRELCGEWSQQAGIFCEAQIAHIPRMTAGSEQEMFRIAQEALANCAKHSDATCVEVHAGVEQGMLMLRVRDNGHGFNVALAEGRGLGLCSMRERVEALGGGLHISSSVGGTRIEARAPLLEYDATPATPASARVSLFQQD